MMKTTINFILTFIFFTSYINAQTTAIPDAAFEQKLIQLGIDSDGLINGLILDSDAALVNNLSIDGLTISSLDGIQAFINLTQLNCSNNALTSLDLTNNTALEELSCNRNSLASIDLTNNIALETLNLGENLLTNLDLSYNVALTNLYCIGNGLTSLDLSNNTSLKVIDVSYGTLSSFDLSSNVALEELTSIGSSLTSLDLTNNIALKKITLRGEQYYNGSLILTNNVALEELNCIGINLTNLDVSTNVLLKKLTCGDDNMTSIDLSNNTALEALSCTNSQLASLDLSNNIALKSLILDYDINLSSLNVRNCVALEELTCVLGNLSVLDLSNCTSLKTLYCQNNHLDTLFVNSADLVELSCSVNQLKELDVSKAPSLIKLYCTKNQLRRLDLTNHIALTTFYCLNNIGLNVCVSSVQDANNQSDWHKSGSTIYTENCYPLSVKGKIVVDDNLNCLVDSSEQGLIGQWVKFSKIADTTESYVYVEGTLGNYKAYLDTGIYIVTVIPTGGYWESCPDSQIVIIDTNYVVQDLNWALQPLLSCPNLQVDIAAPFLRMTGGGSAYTVSYCNVGTIAAQNAFVEVDIDADLNVINSTLPVANQVGTVYTFNLGTVGVGVCGSFNIQVVVDTSAQFQQTHCTEAHIYPDSICSPNWNGPRVDGSVNCQNNLINFIIENRGAAMSSPQVYTIFEDNIAMRVGSVTLGSGQSTTITQAAAAGKTYRIEVDQAPGFPAMLGNLVFSSSIEGCNPLLNGSFNTGYITQFSNGHSAPFMAIDCQQNIASYDPNDKAAQPVGYGVNHYIEQNIAIDYKVRFQNTGTDTAFNIVILDTLSSDLDLTSLQMGTSSHTYTTSITGNVLKVSFPNIMLVDSNANEPLSHGFFRYKIEQNVNNPIGTVIENQAAIYFDYNPAIFTNTTFHTVGENFVPVELSIENVYVDKVVVTAFPNPFNARTTIKVEGKEYNELEVSIFDVSGRLITEKRSAFSNQIELSRGNLHTGIYFYKLKGDGKLLNTGKIMVH